MEGLPTVVATCCLEVKNGTQEASLALAMGRSESELGDKDVTESSGCNAAVDLSVHGTFFPGSQAMRLTPTWLQGLGQLVFVLCTKLLGRRMKFQRRIILTGPAGVDRD